MRTLRILILAGLLTLATVVASAQELTETTTLGPITVQHPANFTVEQVTDNGVGLIDDTDSFAIMIFTSTALTEMGMPEAATAADFMNAVTELEAITGAPSPISLAGAEGFAAEGLIPDIGTNGLIYALDGEDGLIVAMIMAREGDVTEEFRELGESVIDSVVINSSTVTSTDEPEATDEPEDVDSTGCAFDVEALPESTIFLCPAVQITLPEDWQVFEGTEEIMTYASISRGDTFSVSGSIDVNEISPYYNPEMYKTDVVSFTASIVNHDSFDAREHFVTILEEEGRKVEVYNPAKYVDLTKDDVHQVTYIITLNNDLFSTHTYTWVPSIIEDAETVFDDIEAIALSTTLTEDYEGEPAFIEIDGEMVFLFDATVYDSTYSFTFSDDDGVFIVTCPAKMAGDASTVWGTDIYTNDSSVCLAAAHAGVITLADGGTVEVTMLPGEESYEGTARNGVTTLDYGEWGNSFSVAPFELPASEE